jgi:hypothetical protein
MKNDAVDKASPDYLHILPGVGHGPGLRLGILCYGRERKSQRWQQGKQRRF